jgi:hypothetical protein
MLKSPSLALALCAVAAAQSQGPSPDCKLVPGWSQNGPARTFEPDNLFEYMDGNAEGYLLYGFQKMRGVTCEKGGVTFVIDISDMGDADSSYGMFSANRDPRQPAERIGMGGQIVPRRLIFAKGQYYAEIAANPEGDHTAALREFATALERSIPGATALPQALSWFPSDRQQSIRLVPESVLGIRLLKRGYAAQYDFGKGFIVFEETPASAGAVMEKLRARFGETTPAKIADEAFQATDKYLGKLCVFRKGRYIGGYAVTGDADATQLAQSLAAKVD